MDGITNLRAATLLQEMEQEIDDLLEEVETMPVMTPVFSKVMERKSYEWGEAKGRLEGEAKGRFEGEAKGRFEGEAKGRFEGEAKGRLEEKKQTARAMLARGMELDLIADLTGLPEEEIRTLTGSSET